MSHKPETLRMSYLTCMITLGIRGAMATATCLFSFPFLEDSRKIYDKNGFSVCL